MTQQSETYLILKPIAERFNRVASEITDDDIKYIIKQVMKEKLDEKISDAINFDSVAELLQEWVDNNSDAIIHAMQDSVAARLGLPRGYNWY